MIRRSFFTNYGPVSGVKCWFTKTTHRDTLMKTIEKLNELNYNLLPHLTYSPDLAPNDYYLFLNLNRTLQEKKFSSNKDVTMKLMHIMKALTNITIWKIFKWKRINGRNISIWKENMLKNKTNFCQRKRFLEK